MTGSIDGSVQLRVIVRLDVTSQQPPAGPRPRTDLDRHPAPDGRLGGVGPVVLDAGPLPPQQGDGYLVLVGGRRRDELQHGAQIAVVEVVHVAELQQQIALP